MFVGHALLAFSLVAGAVSLLGTDRRRALTLGVAAGAFATVPDVDMAYALAGLAGASVAGAGVGTPLALASAFWASSTVVHRAVTHSLVLAPPAALAAGALAAGLRGDRRATPVALAVVLPLVAVCGVASGPLAAAVMALFGSALCGVVALVVRWGDLGPREVAGTALVGLVSHPFGDLFTGEPPAFLYPLDLDPVAGRVALSTDPTLHLLGAFGLELVTAWLALLVVARLGGVRVLPTPRATVGVGFAAALPVLPAPTLDLSYPFVFGVLAVGLLVLLVELVRDDAPRRGLRAPLTAVTAVTLAWSAYTAAYLAL